uniref:Uncharacterized protein n=1 Tax=viral metagenome TaxID=1070528 RepID=A0A6C0HSR6_9ZZZZ
MRIGSESVFVLGICLLIFIIVMNTGGSCFKYENYSNMNTNNSYASIYTPPPNVSHWSQPTLLIVPNEPLTQGVIDIVSRPKQPIPLPNGQLDMFATTSFSPKCCPNSFSNSMGCACMTLEQKAYLAQRGGNNVPPLF